MTLDINLQPVVLFIGNYGSGKTEVSVNFATNRVSAGIKVQLADLDIVNPYFRSREVKDILEARGIEVILPDQYLVNADLPVVTPKINGVIRQPKGITIIDVGGDDVGALVLASLANSLRASKYDLLQVVNEKRPFTETIEDCIQITREIEFAAKSRITGIVGNTHLMDDTTLETVISGYHYAKNVAKALDVPLKFVTCETSLLKELDISGFDCPVLPITRQLLPPWKRKQNLGSQNFRLNNLG